MVTRPTTNNVLGTYSVGGCWCGESYYVDPTDGVGRVVSSGGSTIELWKVQTSPKVALTKVSSSAYLGGQQDPGFFTTISSNGNANPIIWAVSRPQNSGTGPLHLVAFNPDAGKTQSMKHLFTTTAGMWPNLGGNSNLVPVVANGQVFVASNKQLQDIWAARREFGEEVTEEVSEPEVQIAESRPPPCCSVAESFSAPARASA